jgi:hypothetical protein
MLAILLSLSLFFVKSESIGVLGIRCNRRNVAKIGVDWSYAVSSGCCIFNKVFNGLRVVESFSLERVCYNYLIINLNSHKMKPKKSFSRFVFALLFIGTNSVMAQDEVDDAFDDGITNSNNIAYIDIASTIAGDLAFSYERRLGDRFALEGGVGVLMPWRIPNIVALGESDDYSLDERTGGFSWNVVAKSIKEFARNPAFEKETVLIFRQRIYNFSDTATLEFNQVKHSEIAFGYGGRSELGKNIYLQYYTAVGYRLSSVLDNGIKLVGDDRNGISGLAIMLKFQIGYKF